MLENWLFYMLEIFILLTAVMAVIAKKIFNAAIWLLCCLIGISLMYFWLNFNFVAAIQIMIYVGGIIVIIIFSIFLTQEVDNKMADINLYKKIMYGLLSFILFAVIAHFIYHSNMQTSVHPPHISMQQIGLNLMNIAQPYLLPFELVSILLLAVLIACIVIVSKHQIKIKK